MSLTTLGSPLVVGGAVPQTNKETKMEKPTTRSVRVLRAFFAGGKLHKVDSVAEIDLRLAAEMRNANKVEYIEAQREPAKSSKTGSVSDKKESSNAE